MSEQIPDSFILNKKHFTFIEAEDIDELFDPEKFGLIPEGKSSDCWKGFIVRFRVKHLQLYVDKLYISCRDDIYPRFNGVKAVKSFWIPWMHVYKRIKLPLTYSGTLIIGNDLEEKFHDRAFTGPHCYSETYELRFESGILTGFKNTSGIYEGF